MFSKMKSAISHIAAIAVGATTFKVLKDNGADEVVLIAGTGLAAGVTDTAVYAGLNLLDTKKETPTPQPIIDTSSNDEDDDLEVPPENEDEQGGITMADAFEYFETDLEQAAGSEEIFNKLKLMVSDEGFDENAAPIIMLALQDMYDYEAFNNVEGIINRAKQLYINLGLIIEEESSDEELILDGEPVNEEPVADEESHEQDTPAIEPEPELKQQAESSEKFAENFVNAAEGGGDDIQKLLDEMDGGKISGGTIDGSVLDFARGDMPPVSEEKAQRNQRRQNSSKDKDKQTRTERKFK